MNVKNKKISFEYSIIESYDAGIMLKGTEVKSILENNASLDEAYCYLKNGELFISNFYIAEYHHGTCNNHEPLRVKKILLTKKELKRLDEKASQKGLTIVASHLFFKNGKIKINISLARGKKLYDKRESIKAKDIERDLQRNNV